VLLRGLEPIAAMSARSFGPGLLCRALHVDRALNGVDLLGDTLWLERAPPRAPRPRIARAARIGVAYAGDWAARRWRFFDADSPYVSTATTALRRRRVATAADEE
jgi:DNA-3-methyladenine glycosylase